MLRIYVQEDKQNIYQIFQWENHTLNLIQEGEKFVVNLAAVWTVFLLFRDLSDMLQIFHCVTSQKNMTWL